MIPSNEKGNGGQRAAVNGEQGERAGEVERGGGLVMMRKEIGRLLGDKREGGGLCLH
jgi:hypothetical protein